METATKSIISYPLTYVPPLCPECGYSLQGHHAEGTCPECGLQFGRDSIVIYAWGVGPVTAKSPVTRMLFIGGMAMLFLQPLYYGDILLLPRMMTLMPWYLCIVVVFFYSPSILMLFMVFRVILVRRRCLRTMPAPIQVRFSAAGFVLRVGIGHAKTVAWRPENWFRIEKESNGRLRFKLRAGNKWSPTFIFYPDVPHESIDWIDKRVHEWISAAGDPKSEEV